MEEDTPRQLSIVSNIGPIIFQERDPPTYIITMPIEYPEASRRKPSKIIYMTIPVEIDKRRQLSDSSISEQYNIWLNSNRLQRH